ncbi:MAG: hypothetical protein AAF449_06465 [Myxococcota bacterium]
MSFDTTASIATKPRHFGLVVWIVATFVAAAGVVIFAVHRLRQHIDNQAAQIDILRAQVTALSSGGRLSERMIALERRLGGLPTRVDRLELPMCPNFRYGDRNKPPPSARSATSPDDTPAAIWSVNAAQWRTLALVARNMGRPACIRDLRADQESDGLGQVEVVLSIARQETVEVDLFRDGSIAEAELLIPFATLPASLRRLIRQEECAPRKVELSVRPPVNAADIRKLTEWWRPLPTGEYPPLIEQLVVEIDCGPELWDLELSADGTVLRDGRSEF